MWYIRLEGYALPEDKDEKSGMEFDRIPTLREGLIMKYHFIDYAAKYWSEHFQRAMIPGMYFTVVFHCTSLSSYEV